MKKPYLHIALRIIYYTLSLVILSTSIYQESTNTLIYSIDDYLFLFILGVSFILVNQYSIRLKDTNLIFNDFIIIILYIKFHINLLVIILFVSYLIISIIDHRSNRNQNLITENRNLFNNCLFILSTYLSHLAFTGLNNIYGIQNYEFMSVIIFSFVFLLSNYILFCVDLSFQKNQFVVITLQNGLYYVILNFILCTAMAALSIFLYGFYGYIPIAILTSFIIFISFSMSRLDKLTVKNTNLQSLMDCTTFLISQADFKVKLQHAIEVVEEIIPFECCGIYLFRDKYSTIYPISYKTNHMIQIDDLKFLQTNDNEVFRQILVGNILNYESSAISSNFPVINNLSKHIKTAIIVPLKDFSGVIGFILICVNHYNDLNEESNLLGILGNNIGIVYSNINNIIRNNVSTHKNIEVLARYLEYNIKEKILFTLGVMEIQNFDEIIRKYNSDFYEAFKNEAGKMISKALSHNDYLLCFDKDDIYIVFNLLDYKNSLNKLHDLSLLMESFSLRGVSIKAKATYAACEYPVEGISSDEIISKTYRKLHKEKNA